MVARGMQAVVMGSKWCHGEASAVMGTHTHAHTRQREGGREYLCGYICDCVKLSVYVCVCVCV